MSRLIEHGGQRLSRLERFQIRFIEKTLEPGPMDDAMRACQRTVGQAWIHHCTKHLKQVSGLGRLPEFDRKQSYLLVSNHRSFFDLYVITGELVRRGLQHRIVFPVRSNFFYDTPQGLLVNGIMSFFAMYPPIFRERHKAVLNVHSLSELADLLRRGGAFAGLHPEGRRNQGEDPYCFLPAQRGVGKVIYESRVTVIPVFINGLINDLYQQVRSNFDGTGRPVYVVFGEPVRLWDLLERRPSPRLHQAIADRCVEAIGALGQEERAWRAATHPRS